MFVFDVCVQIAGVSEVGYDLLLTQLALRLVTVLRFSVHICLKSKIAPTGDLVLILFVHESSSHLSCELIDRACMRDLAS